ncbi:OmpA family protein [Chitinophaga barathri]|uniref:OmpA-like domain-containing protein n=1 Tax=Chitinophaga barathri TaxID=1647451 RepID=A0A3N4MEQ3_9BACT|nr:OmpA family protein [Chitinophaga barathri]RPD41835.1 hypothetical protein EG028_06630 [Chitinophaga barathri]
MNNRHLLLLYLVVLFPFAAPAQEQPSYDQLGDKYFVTGRYDKAASVYERLGRKKNAGPLVLYRLGFSQEALGNTTEAIAAYAACIGKDPKADSLWIRIGDLQKMNGQYGEAKTAYTKYPAAGADAERIKQRMAGCDSAELWLKDPAPVILHNEDRINTTFSDWGAFRQQDMLIYTSNFNRLDYSGQRISRQTNEPYFSLYRLDDGSSPGRLNIDKLSKIIDLSNYHTGPVCYSPVEGTSFVTVSQRDKPGLEKDGYKHSIRVRTWRLELYEVTKDSVKPFAYNDARAFSTGHAALNGDGSVLYFISDRPGGHGHTDIWFSKRNVDGSWQQPVNCGPVINTADDEMFPVMDADGVLYFASDGHAGMGGLDMFAATGSETQWTAPMNLRVPYNSSHDDFYLVTSDTLSGYFASNRPGGKGSDDIYTYAMIPPPPPVPPPPPPPVKPESPYEVGKSFVLKDLYYDFNKYFIRTDAGRVLDSLFVILQEHPTMRIELQSHTDSRGNDAYNMRLSKERAEAAVNYLVSKGISADRMVPQGYGESRPVNHCVNGVKCSEEEHQANRRTEVKILQK